MRFSGGLVKLMVGLDDLNGLFQPEGFYMILWFQMDLTDGVYD